MKTTLKGTQRVEKKGERVTAGQFNWTNKHVRLPWWLRQ